MEMQLPYDRAHNSPKQLLNKYDYRIKMYSSSFLLDVTCVQYTTKKLFIMYWLDRMYRLVCALNKLLCNANDLSRGVCHDVRIEQIQTSAWKKNTITN
jgi:hypothetical protein